MKLLVIGSGGREHALICKLLESPLCEEVYCAPGNAGISQIATCVDIGAEDIDLLCEFAKNNKIGLTVIGPEAPLVAGIVDKFESEGLKVFGPNKQAAAFEGSKKHTKSFLSRHEIPTARHLTAYSFSEAKAAIEESGFPLVVKADGLAGGKGVFICQDEAEAINALDEIMVQKTLGAAGDSVVLEEYLDGFEVSALCFVDGNTIIPMEFSRDYKRAYDDDEGLNTGGMGAYSPNPAIDAKLAERITKTIINPVMKAIKAEKINYKGVLYVGLMITQGQIPKVLEFNVRFGDPETQALMPRLKSDLVKIMLNCTDGLLSEEDVVWSSKSTVCVVASSKEYPGACQTGFEITGLDDVGNAYVYHGATTKTPDGKVLTAGGRVLNICAKAETLKAARILAYEAVSKINFEGMRYRTDIAKSSSK
ncbi:MAG: phosphoribosylamine--glycine ligase [Eubacteriaceae bacterium]|nr:phosphoribosylamine--glycine ligase [Eubacteriaceae bacterium]